MKLKQEDFCCKAESVQVLSFCKVKYELFSICSLCLLLSEVTTGHCPHRRFRAFVEVLSSLQADQEQSESSTFEVSSRLTLSADSSALNSSSLRAEQKAGLTRLSLSVLNIHQRLSHLTPRSLSQLSKASPFCKLTLLFFLHFSASHLSFVPFSAI